MCARAPRPPDSPSITASTPVPDPHVSQTGSSHGPQATAWRLGSLHPAQPRAQGGARECTNLEANKKLAVRWLNLVSDGDVEQMCRITAPTWRLHGGPQGLPPGPDGLHALFTDIGPVDQKWTIDDVIAEGDRVVVRATNSCIQDEFLGIPAHGTRQVFTATFTFRITGDLVAETWRNADDLGRLLQLGARVDVPARGLDSEA